MQTQISVRGEAHRTIPPDYVLFDCTISAIAAVAAAVEARFTATTGAMAAS